ncbi:Hypothetical protein FKW44_017432 [Caligus rogercresseyi]|uniref:Uncharacterized protein n=1 Tax=Caligus rogercresseyi TaxID=217165 RepID=A0A7T8GSX1_CALRO|nr:Hypothetical protein FKW44_017432 [Caligus rogercresseyi]
MGLRVLPNTLGVFWGYKPTANGPSGSAEHTRGVWGYKFPANGPRVPPNLIGCFGVTYPLPIGPWFRQT